MAGGERPLVIAWAAEDTPTRLHALEQAETRGDVWLRLHALWLLGTGHRIRAVAAVLGVHERNVQRWVGWYRLGGLAAMRQHRRQGQGKAAWLSREQQAQLVVQSTTGEFRTAAEVRQ